jgi:adenosylcobinamide amidohydrolase
MNDRTLRTKHVLKQDTLIIDLGQRRSVLSSAPCRGGFIKARYVLNHQVKANPIAAPQPVLDSTWGDPARYLGRLAAGLGLQPPCVALMTAVPLSRLVLACESRGPLWVEGFLTVGVSNAVKAGEPVGNEENERMSRRPGTINIVLITNAHLSASAMVGAVQVVTESKTATLLSSGVRSWTGRRGATGTGTDAVVIVGGDGPALRYSGTHTQLGELIGRLVERGLRKGLGLVQDHASDHPASPSDNRLAR